VLREASNLTTDGAEAADPVLRFETVAAGEAAKGPPLLGMELIVHNLPKEWAEH
jgi:hypothetical protein